MKKTHSDQQSIKNFIREVLSEDATKSYQEYNVIDPELRRMFIQTVKLVQTVRSLDGYPNSDVAKEAASLIAELTDAKDWMAPRKHPATSLVVALVSALATLEKLSGFLNKPMFFKKGDYQEKVLHVAHGIEQLIKQFKRYSTSKAKTFG